MSDFLLFSYSYSHGKNWETLGVNDIEKKLDDTGFIWVHLDATCDETEEFLYEKFPFLDDYIVKALVDDATRPRYTEYDEGAVIVLRGANLNEDSDAEDMVSVRMWVDKNRVISVRHRKLRAVLDIQKRIKDLIGPKTTSEFLSLLVTRLFERMEPSIGKLDDYIDEAEEQLVEKPNIELREKILILRKKAILFRRHISPQREALSGLRNSSLKWFKLKDKRIIHESYNHTHRFIEDLDAIRERAQIIKDELANILADKLNKNMYILSVIAAIFLPLGFLTGLLGINVGGIPGSENPSAFYIFSGILIFIVVLQIVIFKKLKWF